MSAPPRFRRRGMPAPPRPEPDKRSEIERLAYRPLAEVPYRYAPAPEPARAPRYLDTLRALRLTIALSTVGLVPVVFWRATFDFFNLTKITIIWLAAIACIALGAAEALLGGARARFGHALRIPFPMAASVVALVAAATLATATSLNRTTSVIGRYHRYNGLLGLVALAVLAAFLALDLRRHVHMRALLGVQLAATLLGVAYAVLQWNGSTPCGEACFRDPAPFGSFEWESSSRVFGTWGNPDFLAAASAVGALAALGLALSAGRLLERVAFLAGAVACGMGVWVSAPRNQGWLALGAGLTGVVFLYRDRFSKVLRALLAVAAAVIVAVLVLSAWHPGRDRAPGALGRVEDRFRATLDVREHYWGATVRAFASRPLTGEGLDTFAETFARHRSIEHAARYGIGTITDKPHSVPLEWFQSAGITGGMAFLLLAGGSIAVADRARRRLSGPGLPVRQGILAGGVGMLCAYLVQSAVSIDVPPLWASFWWSLGLIAAASRGAPDRLPASPNAPTRARQIAVGLLTFSALLAAWVAVRPIRADLAFRRATGGPDYLAYEAAISANPYEAFYRASLGQSAALTALQRPELAPTFVPLAVENYERAAALEPGNPYHGQRAYQFHDGLAQIGIDPESNKRLAEEWWQRTIEVDPRDPDVLIEGGILRLHADDAARAASRFEEALSIRPESAGALKGLGEARRLLGDHAGAVGAYKRALELAPDDVEAQEGLRAAEALAPLEGP